MANKQTAATAAYRKRQGIISKNFKLKRELCEEFAKACEKVGISQAEAVKQFMEDFVKKNS